MKMTKPVKISVSVKEILKLEKNVTVKTAKKTKMARVTVKEKRIKVLLARTAKKINIFFNCTKILDMKMI